MLLKGETFSKCQMYVSGIHGGGACKIYGLYGDGANGVQARTSFYTFTTGKALFLERIYKGQILFSFIFMHYFLH